MKENTKEIQAAIRERFAEVARGPSQETGFPMGVQNALGLGYSPEAIRMLPNEAIESFCGVGDPLGLGEPQLGETVLDLGCGAGLDCFLAGFSVGESGRVYGVDMEPEMVAKATRTAKSLGLRQVEFRVGHLEGLSFPDNFADRMISNGVFNLCPDKPQVLAEAFRVLKPGGWLQIADILQESNSASDEGFPAAVHSGNRLADWSG